MSLSGKIGTMPIADILQWVAMGKKSGVLSFYHRGLAKNLYFEGGDIVSAGSNNPREYLGQFLISAGRISEQDLKRAFITQQETSIYLGKILCLIGKITEEELVRALNKKVEETIYDLFLWSEGEFEFKETPGAAMHKKDIQVRVRLAVPQLIMEGAQRFDEWRRLRREFPDLRMVVRSLRPLSPEKYPAGSRKRRLLELLAAERTLAELALELRTDEIGLFQVILQLREAGYIEVLPPTDSRAMPLDPALFRGDWREALKRLLAEERFAEAIEFLDERVRLDDQPHEPMEARKRIEAHYEQALRHALAPLSQVPQLGAALQPALQLSAEEGFIVSRVNGEYDLDTIVRISPLPAWITLQALKKFLDQGLIVIRQR